jgi:hypothetical protein
MEDIRIPKKMLTYDTERRRNIGCPQLRWKNPEQTKHGLIYKDDDDGISAVRMVSGTHMPVYLI